MNSPKNFLTLSLATIFAMASVGCGQGFKTNSKAGNEAQSSSGMGSDTNTDLSRSVDVSQQLQKAAEASALAEKAMGDAQAAIAQIMDSSGNINLGLFQPSTASANSKVTANGILAPVVDKLNTVFDQVFSKIDFVKVQFNSARGILAQALAQLNAALPGQSAQVQQIQDQLAKIDALEGKFQSMVHLLAGKLDLASSAIDKLVNTATSFIPIPGIGMIAGVLIDMYVVGDVKDLIASVKAKLLAV